MLLLAQVMVRASILGTALVLILALIFTVTEISDCAYYVIIIIIIIIFINCIWVITWWQWLFYMYTNMK
jgi:hypothetical protein